MEQEKDNKVSPRKLELLAPAKNLECGIAAIDHGADAVYIGAPKFGARAAAGNSLDDIKQLCEYAHQFGAKVHVTVNTIIYDNEMKDTLEMIAELDRIGVDALLLQDMGVLWETRAGKLWHRHLHSSTQCDARSADKVAWLHHIGFSRVVLARELSLDEIRAIHEKVPYVELEAFVHGALCVSYSGVCYASEKCFARSANRGECAQFCRMKFNLVDSDNQEIEHQRHLLSLKDLCQIDHVKDLADAGVCSFKIEGRLKDVNYVKNVVAAYSQKLDEIVASSNGKYIRASMGETAYNFQPNLKKTFNRGYTNYFLNGRQPDIASFDTPKAMGEFVGKVKEIRGTQSFNVATVASFANGDGLCFINDEGELEGFRVNRVEGNRLFPLRMPENLRPGMALYRNNDQAFENILARKTASRKIPVILDVQGIYENPSVDQPSGILVTAKAMMTTPYLKSTDLSSVAAITRELGEVFYEMPLEEAKRPQGDNIRMQLSKLGTTRYECKGVSLQGIEEYFVPNSVLSAIRRELVEKMNEKIEEIVGAPLQNGFMEELMSSPYLLDLPGEVEMKPEEFVWQPAYGKWKYLYNVANYAAVDFYRIHGLEPVTQAFELGVKRPLEWDSKNEEEYQAAVKTDRMNFEAMKAAGVNKKVITDAKGESLLMQCRHCIRYSLGYCVKRGGKKPQWKEPLYLELGDGRRFRLEFNCAECQMQVYSI